VYDFVVVQILRPHLRLIGRALVFIPGVHPPLAWLHPSADEVPGHRRPVQTIQWEQRHQLLHLYDQLWSLIPGYSLVWNVTDVAQRSTVGFFADVKPFLIPISDRGVPRTAQKLLLHPISERQVYSTDNFGAALGPFLPQAKQVTKEVEMGLDSHIRLAQMDKD
jgi:hypothetical protein